MARRHAPFDKKKRGAMYCSPRFLCRPTALYIFARAVGRQRAIHTKTADLPLRLLVGTFPRFVAIGFYFLSETLI